MDDRDGAKGFAIFTIVIFAIAVVIAIGPCTMLFDFGSDPGAGRPRPTWSLFLVLWAACELFATPFLIGIRLDEAELPTAGWAAIFWSGIAVIVGGMVAIGITFGPRIPSIASPWPLVAAGALAIVVGTRLARMVLFRRRK